VYPVVLCNPTPPPSISPSPSFSILKSKICSKMATYPIFPLGAAAGSRTTRSELQPSAPKWATE